MTKRKVTSHPLVNVFNKNEALERVLAFIAGEKGSRELPCGHDWR